jgi:hypothetical protein
MFSISLCRIVLDSLFLVFAQNADRHCVSELNYKPMYTIVYNVIGNYVLHFLPITVILKIYYFDHRVFLDREELIPRYSSPPQLH